MAAMELANRLEVESPMIVLPSARTILTKNWTTPEASRALTVGSGVEEPVPGSSVPQAAASEPRTNKHESLRSIVSSNRSSVDGLGPSYRGPPVPSRQSIAVEHQRRLEPSFRWSLGEQDLAAARDAGQTPN